MGTVKKRNLYQKVRSDFPFGRGEAEAIALAIAERAHLVAIDDKHGINACKLLPIPFTTAVDIFIRMREKNLIEKDAALIRLEVLRSHGRYKAEIIKHARSKREGK